MRETWDKLLAVIAGLGAFTQLIIDVTIVTFRRPPAWSLTRDQLYGIGVMSLPVVAVTGFSTGLILATQAWFQLSDLGLAGATGLMVGKSMVTELGPVLTAFMVTGRVGAAMCAELGTMQVSEQIAALRSMAVNPLRYLVAPRFVAGSLMLPPLTVFSMVMGIIGGYLIAVYFFGMPATTYLDPMPQHITAWDFTTGMIKALCFGILISTISCYKGMTTSGGAAGVGRATTNSVVICYTMILFVNFLLNLLLNLIHTTWKYWV
ncbi:MAG: MlaE family ABC transporter permease [Parachlamydiales bacterium]